MYGTTPKDIRIVGGPPMYKILVEDALLRQVIADRKAQFAALTVEDERLLPLADELTRLYLARGRLVHLYQREIERRNGRSPY
jgi:hypothetical protein